MLFQELIHTQLTYLGLSTFTTIISSLYDICSSTLRSKNGVPWTWEVIGYYCCLNHPGRHYIKQQFHTIWSRGVHANRRPNKTDQPNQSQPVTTGSDRSQPLETNYGGLSGKFHPQKLEPPNLLDKNLKKAENYLDQATRWHSSALIRPRLVFLYSNPLKSSQDLLSSSLRYA